MDITKIFNKKDYRNYKFNWVINESNNFQECVENVKFLFEQRLGPSNITCDWNAVNSNNSTEISGSFTTLGKWQNKLRRRLDSHPCGDFSIVLFLN